MRQIKKMVEDRFKLECASNYIKGKLTDLSYKDGLLKQSTLSR